MSGYRQATLGIGGVAVLLLIWLVNPWFTPEGDLRSIVTIAFWILAIALVVVLYLDRRATGPRDVSYSGPAFTQFLFHDARAGLLWLPIRVFLGFSWLESGLGKITGTGWLDGGAALQGYWTNAVKIPEQGRPPISYEWYRDFIQFLLDNEAWTWFAPLIAFGEVAVGLGLLFGGLTGIAAFFGALMNMSFLLAGSASTNPIMFTLAVGVMLAWRVAGYYGIDRWLLPILGTPWQRGTALGGEEPEQRPPA
jgi:thiosulfate dehydrogenase [quinone] large subunit